MFGFDVVRKKDLNEIREAMTIYKRALEDIGWIPLNSDGYSKDGVLSGEDFKKMIQRSKLYYHSNPLAGHWVNLTTYFVFGEGVGAPKAKDKKIQEVINKFWADRDNQIALTSFLSQQKLCNKLQYEGNLFFVLFPNEAGDIRVRILNTEEILDIIKDESDRMRPRFYKIQNLPRKYNYTSDTYDISTSRVIYYPDWDNFNPEDAGIPDNKLKKDAVIYHVKINCDINDKFGIPELYRGLDWIKANKDMAGDLATLIKSLSTIAWKKKIKGTATQVNALKSLYHAKTDLSNVGPTAGSTQIENQNLELEPINTPTGGAAIGKEGLRQMKLMVCAGAGIFEHYFGDPSTGNLATATSMELPMIKKFAYHQKIWADIFDGILHYQINKKIELGILPGKTEYDNETERNIYTSELDLGLDIDFPPIIEKDLKVLAESLQIATQGGMCSKDTAARIFLLAAGQNNIEDEIKKIEVDPVPAPDPAAMATDKKPAVPSSEEKPLKESDPAALPSRTAALRLTKKNNYVLQRMNGYKKALLGHFRTLQESISKNAKASGNKGQIVGGIDNLDECLHAFAKDMKASASTYFPIAIDIGSKFLQSHLKEAQIHESIFEATRAGKTLLQQKLDWNDQYIDTSLIPDMETSIMESVRQAYDEEADFLKAINNRVSAFESRVTQYAGAFWGVEEAAVKEAGSGTGIMVNFVGADDHATCEGCKIAMDGNPYPIDEAPEPGSHECDGRCRHALQIIQ